MSSVRALAPIVFKQMDVYPSLVCCSGAIGAQGGSLTHVPMAVMSHTDKCRVPGVRIYVPLHVAWLSCIIV